MLSKSIHKVSKTDYVWFNFLWIRRYVGQIYVVDFAKFCGLLRIYELYLCASDCSRKVPIMIFKSPCLPGLIGCWSWFIIYRAFSLHCGTTSNAPSKAAMVRSWTHSYPKWSWFLFVNMTASNFLGVDFVNSIKNTARDRWPDFDPGTVSSSVSSWSFSSVS